MSARGGVDLVRAVCCTCALFLADDYTEQKSRKGTLIVMPLGGTVFELDVLRTQFENYSDEASNR